MKTKDERSLKVLTDWNSREYKNEGQKAAALQVLINSALDEQDKLTRHAIVTKLETMKKEGYERLFTDTVKLVIENTKAI